MIVDFTPDEKKLLEGKGASIARKNNCTSKYVRFIIEGERNIETDLAKNIFADCKAFIELLTPKQQ